MRRRKCCGVCEPSAAHTPWRGVYRRDVAIFSAVLEASSWSWHRHVLRRRRRAAWSKDCADERPREVSKSADLPCGRPTRLAVGVGRGACKVSALLMLQEDAGSRRRALFCFVAGALTVADKHHEVCHRCQQLPVQVPEGALQRAFQRASQDYVLAAEFGSKFLERELLGIRNRGGPGRSSAAAGAGAAYSTRGWCGVTAVWRCGWCACAPPWSCTSRQQGQGFHLTRWAACESEKRNAAAE